jgi:hypothetical protein
MLKVRNVKPSHNPHETFVVAKNPGNMICAFWAIFHCLDLKETADFNIFHLVKAFYNVLCIVMHLPDNVLMELLRLDTTCLGAYPVQEFTSKHSGKLPAFPKRFKLDLIGEAFLFTFRASLTELHSDLEPYISSGGKVYPPSPLDIYTIIFLYQILYVNFPVGITSFTTAVPNGSVARAIPRHTTGTPEFPIMLFHDGPHFDHIITRLLFDHRLRRGSGRPVSFPSWMDQFVHRTLTIANAPVQLGREEIVKAMELVNLVLMRDISKVVPLPWDFAEYPVNATHTGQETVSVKSLSVRSNSTITSILLVSSPPTPVISPSPLSLLHAPCPSSTPR